MTVLIDSDVCLDLLTGRHPFFNAAKELFARAENNHIDAVVSADSFINVLYILGTEYSDQVVLNKMKVLRSLITIGGITERAIDFGLQSGWKDIEDAVQNYCAVHSGCETILTRNTADFKHSGLDVYTPPQFLSIQQ